MNLSEKDFIPELKKMKKHLEILINNYPDLISCQTEIEQTYNKLLNVFKSGNKLLICGNGGSASDADHISGELLKKFGKDRPLSFDWQKKLGPELAENLEGALPTIPLTNFNSLITAFSNDRNAEYAFAQLTWGLGNEGDALLCISTSGNSINVLHAANVAKAKSMTTIGLSGSSGGRLIKEVDLCICVPDNNVYRIQEYHLPIYHCICLMLEDELFQD